MALPDNILNLDPVDFCGKQVMSFQEALWIATFEDPQLRELLTIIPGVKAKQQVVILGFLGLLGKKANTTQCAPEVSDSNIPAVQKFYNPAYIEDRFTECWKNLLEKFTVWGLKSGIRKPDLTGTDFANFLEERVLESLRQAIYRIVWFADTAAENIADGGNLTAGLDPEYFTMLNGFWKQFFAIATANPGQRVTIAKNSGASYALQAFTPTDTTNQVVTGYFQSIVTGMDERLAGMNPKFFVTRSIAEQYRAERRAFANIDLAYMRTEEGWDMLEYAGYPVIVLNFEDRMIKEFFNTGTAWHLPHRIYFTTIENLHLATEEEGALSEIDAFFDKKDKQYYIDVLFALDTMVVEDYKVMLAY